MRAPHEAQGVACIAPDTRARSTDDPVAKGAAAWALQRACGVFALAAAAALSACGSGGGDAAADGSSASAVSVAQQTVGADLLPPDAAIAGTASASTDLPDEDLSPANANANASTSASDLLPPG